MKTVRKIVFILLGISLLLLAVATIFHVQPDTAYGDCVNNICTDKVRTNYWGVALYAGLGLSFILAVILTLVHSGIRLWQIFKMGSSKK